jgi:hypothetical protein
MQRSIEPSVFAEGDLFHEVAAGCRTTRRFKIGWTVWSNAAWLDLQMKRPLAMGA